MTTIYMNNIFRSNNYLKYNDGYLCEIPFFINFDYSDANLMALLKYGVNCFLENVLFFDKIFINIFELPILLFELYKIDEDCLNYLIDNNILSTIIMEDITICAIKNKNTKRYSLCSLCRKNIDIKNVEDFENYVKEYSMDYDYKNIHLNKLYQNSIFYSSVDDRITVVKNIDFAIKNGKYRKCNIGNYGTYRITGKNKGLYDCICQIELDKNICKKNNIDFVWFDDITNVIDGSYDYNKEMIEKWNEILRIKEIPNILYLLNNDSLNFNDIVKLKNNKNFKNMVNWINSIKGKDIKEEFIKILSKKNFYDKLPMKIFRLVFSNGVGIFSPIGGVSLSLVDNIVSNKVNQNSINSVEKILNKKQKRNKNYNGFSVEVEVKNKISIDTSEEVEIYNNKCGEQAIRNIFFEMQASKSEDILNFFLEKAFKIYNAIGTYECFYELSSCLLEYSLKCNKISVSEYENIFNDKLKIIKKESEEKYYIILSIYTGILLNILNEKNYKKIQVVLDKYNCNFICELIARSMIIMENNNTITLKKYELLNKLYKNLNTSK